MSDHRLLTAGIVMAIIGSIVVGGIVYSTIRFRRRREQEGYKTDRRITIVEQGHPASQITPYSSSQNPAGDAPNFLHNPGQNMRIATRRLDGGWQFSSPREGFNPAGVDDFAPSPTSATHLYSQSISSTSKLSTKGGGFSRKKGFEAEYEFEPSPDVLPPPAYAYGPDTPGYTKDPPSPAP